MLDRAYMLLVLSSIPSLTTNWSGTFMTIEINIMYHLKIWQEDIMYSLSMIYISHFYDLIIWIWVVLSISGSITLLLTWLHDYSMYYDNYVYCATCNEIFARILFDPWPIGRHMLPVCLACDSDGWIPWCVIIILKNIIK